MAKVAIPPHMKGLHQESMLRHRYHSTALRKKKTGIGFLALFLLETRDFFAP
jgi:hypothetical protein